MIRPGFTESVLLACAMSAGGRLLATPAMWLLGTRVGAMSVLTMVCLTYLVYLVRRSGVRTGRLTAITAWAGITLVAWLAPVTLAKFAMIQVAVLWLLRSLFFYDSILSAAADLLLSAAGLVIAMWCVTQTHGLGAGLWGFFLVQSLFVTIPADWRPGWRGGHSDNGQDRFDHAWHCARTAAATLGAQPRTSRDSN